ncbi:MAG: hypothetical protein AAGG72_07375 [Pseudomonadota bacterium]
MVDGAASATLDLNIIGDGMKSSFEQEGGAAAASNGHEFGAHWRPRRESQTLGFACESEPGGMLF